MCSITLAFGALSAVTSLIGSVQQARSQRQAAEFNARIAERNALIRQQDAATAAKVGAKKDTAIAIRGRLLRGLQLAGGASRGLLVDPFATVDGDTGALRLAQTMSRTGSNIAENRFETAQRTRGLLLQSGDFKSQAEITRFEGSAKSSSTLLTGAGNAIKAGGTLATGLADSLTVSPKWDAFGNPTETNDFFWDL